MIACFALDTYADVWSEIELNPYFHSRSRTLYDWHRNGFVTDIPRLIQKSGLNFVEKPKNFIQFFNTEASLDMIYKFVEVRIGLFDHRIVGGDEFTLDDLELSESFVFVGREGVVRFKIGRQKMQVGHELVIGFKDWSASPLFYDSANLFFVVGPLSLEVFNAKLLDKTALAFLTLKEQILQQPQLTLANQDFWFADTDLRGAVASFDFGPEQRNWIQAYWVHFFNLNPFSSFNEFSFFKTVGVAHHWLPLHWLLIDGEAAYQYGRYTRQLSLSAWAIYERVTFFLQWGRFKIQPNLAFWFATGDETVFTSRITTGQPGDNGVNLGATTDGRYSEFIYVRPDFHDHLGALDIFGLSNLLAFSASMSASIVFAGKHHISASLDGYLYFIQDRRGVIRNADGFVLMVAPSGTQERFMGAEIDLLLNYHYDIFDIDFIFGVFIPGPYAMAHFWKHEAGVADPDTVSLLVLDFSLTFD